LIYRELTVHGKRKRNLVHPVQTKNSTELNGVNQFTPIQFSSQFGSAKLEKVWFAVQQNAETELN